ncbi:PAS domain-containing sensor histidine kinase [Fulvivirga lutimaris]|uniref:PAS domain-containing sensor histidine kinase n=1 Tax=Fulvivirga lutimaris TaxID=1819566 RepID=UPI001625DA52|nr:PAS domain-containing sensor histidine kinase [Fulvivirga lutimaris]
MTEFDLIKFSATGEEGIALNEEEKMFRSIIERSNDIIIITGGDYLIKYITPSVKMLLGMEPEEVQGKSLFDFIDPAKETSLKEFVKSNNDSLKDKLTEVCLQAKKGKTVFFDVTISNLLDHNKIEGLVINLHDITARKLAEEKLQKANHELDQFIYKTSHDLRAPLLSALGLVELAERDPEKESHNYLRMIKMSLNKLDNFIEDINSFYRNEKLAIRNERINFDEIVKDELNQLTNFYNTDNVKVNYNLNRISDLYSDSVRIRTILTNVISNALKYSDKGKDESFININIQVTPDECLIKVEDNGIGIRQQYMGNIFDIFYRADENAKGSGLGLYIVKDTIDKLGGHVQVFSEYGKGTTFTISVPNFLNVAPGNLSLVTKS